MSGLYYEDVTFVFFLKQRVTFFVRLPHLLSRRLWFQESPVRCHMCVYVHSINSIQNALVEIKKDDLLLGYAAMLDSSQDSISFATPKRGVAMHCATYVCHALFNIENGSDQDC